MTRTLVVAPNGSAFASVQAAVDAACAGRRGASERVVIHIKPGVYKEPIVVSSSKPFVTFRGESAATTILTFDRAARKKRPDGTEYGTSGSASVMIEGDDFHAEGLSFKSSYLRHSATFENSAGRGKNIEQALAVKLTADRAVFKNCRFLGWQDTLYAGGANCRQYFRGCTIEGDVDFIFGQAAAVFDRCKLHSKGPGYIAAQARLGPDVPTGYVFRDCDLSAGPGVPPGSVFLGRPWRPYSRVVFIGCQMGPHLRPEGWHNWNDATNEATAWFAERNSRGPGADPRARAKWSRQLSRDEAAFFETRRFLAGGDNWNPEANP